MAHTKTLRVSVLLPVTLTLKVEYDEHGDHNIARVAESHLAAGYTVQDVYEALDATGRLHELGLDYDEDADA